MWSWHSLDTDQPHPNRPALARQGAPYVVPRRGDRSLALDWIDVTVDPTGGSTSQDASALGLIVVAGAGQRRFVLDDRTPGPRTWLQTVADVKAALRAALVLAGPQPKIRVLIEKKALGAGLIEQLEKSLHDGELLDARGRPIVAAVEAYEPRGSKEQRASAMEPDISAGLVYLADGAPWAPAWLEEFGAHPRGSRNDRIDALAQCLDHHRTEQHPWIKMFSAGGALAPVPKSISPGAPRACEHTYVDGKCTACGYFKCRCDLSGYVVPSADDRGKCSCGGMRVA